MLPSTEFKPEWNLGGKREHFILKFALASSQASRFTSSESGECYRSMAAANSPVAWSAGIGADASNP